VGEVYEARRAGNSPLLVPESHIGAFRRAGWMLYPAPAGAPRDITAPIPVPEIQASAPLPAPVPEPIETGGGASSPAPSPVPIRRRKKGAA